jgi:hypothetical protein
MPLPVVVSFRRRSCRIVPWSPMTLLHSGCTPCHFPDVSPFEVPCMASSLLCPLCGAGTARRVVHLQTATNFFRDPPSPWVHLFCCQRRPTARCQSPYRPSSAVTHFLQPSWKSKLLTSEPPTRDFGRRPHIMFSCVPDVATFSALSSDACAGCRARPPMDTSLAQCTSGTVGQPSSGSGHLLPTHAVTLGPFFRSFTAP